VKIHWSKNPLETEVELDTPQEEKLLRACVCNDELISILAQVQGVITWDDKGPEDAIKEARKEMEEYSRISEHVDTIIPVFRQSLMASHIGDCVCVAASCIKCRAERFLGINTIKGLNKNAGASLDEAFSKSKVVTNDGHDYDLKRALDYLHDYDPAELYAEKVKTYDWYPKFFPKWKESATQAYEWLKKYQEEHYPDYNHANEDLAKDLRLVYSL
jgi:hypothetical protein